MKKQKKITKKELEVLRLKKVREIWEKSKSYQNWIELIFEGREKERKLYG